MQVLITFLVFASVFSAVWGLYLWRDSEQRQMLSRVKNYTKKLERNRGGGGPASRSLQSLSFKGLLRETARIFAAKESSKKWEVELVKAGWPLRGEEFLVIQLASAVLAPGVLFLVTTNLPLALMGILLGWMLPRLMLTRAKAKRAALFNSQIGDALVIMANSLRAGFGFLQAMEMVSREMPAPIAEEFGRALREMNLGKPTEEALAGMTRRIESEDMDLVLTAVLIQRQVGGNLAEILDTISFTIRERVRIKGEVKTLTAQGRISGWVVGLLPVAVASFLAVINPEYLSILFKNPMGLLILVLGATSELIGVFLIRKITDIKV